MDITTALLVGIAATIVGAIIYEKVIKPRLGRERREAKRPAPSKLLLPRSGVMPTTEGMLGRDKDIAELKGLLENCKFLGIIGLAGIGKSTVAAKLGEDLGGKYRVCWEDMSGPYEFNAFVSELLSEIGGVSAERIKDYTPEQRISALIGILDEKPSLLVLDNFEHRLEDRTISDLYLSQLLGACCTKDHRSKIIITSRVNPDGLYAGYSKYDLGGIEKGSGVELLKRRGLKAEVKTLEFAEEKVDRHPYALQLLASLVISYGADLKRCLEEREIWPEEMEKEFLGEHYDRMSREERTILEGMSVYREPVPEEAVAVFDGDNVYELLRSLRNKSLVQSADELCFLHPIVRDYAYDKLVKKPTAHHKAGEWYEKTYGMAPAKHTNSPHLLKPYQEMIFQYFGSATKDDILKGASIANYVGKFLQRFGLHDKKIHMLQRSREALERAALQNTKDYAAHLNNIGMIHKARGEYDEALRYYKDSLKIKKEIGDRVGEAATLNNIGSIHGARGEYDEALRYYNDSLKIQRELGERSGEATMLNNIGMTHYARGKYDEALRYYDDSLKIHRELGDRAGAAATLNNIGSIHYARGEYDEALRYYNDSLKMKKEMGDRAGEAATLNNIGEIHRARGEYDEAFGKYRESLKIKRGVGDRAGEATTLGNIGMVCQARRDYDKALKYHQDSLKMERQLGNLAGEATSLHNIGTVYFQKGQYEKAAEYIVPAYQIAKEIGMVEAEGGKKLVDALSEKLGKDLLKEDSKQ